MDTIITDGTGRFDLLGYVTETVRKAIEIGLIKSTSIFEFDLDVETMEESELEDYLQDLWDNI